MEARHALRQQQSRPLLGVIQKQIEIARSTALLGGALAKGPRRAPRWLARLGSGATACLWMS